MPQCTTRRLVRFTPRQMYDLVADVERYPQFLPLCESLTVQSRDTTAAGHERIVSRLSVGYGLVHETFTTEVLLKEPNLRIDVRYLEGAFRKLDNRWAFRPVPGGCEIEFFIDYEFASLPLQLLMGAMFDKAFRKFSEAFEARAETVYGPVSA
jgi:coenzyme Q-binding protein COQ10